MDDLVNEFLTETNESLEVLDHDLVEMEKNPNDPKIVGNIFRVMHTIKGTCGFIGLTRLESVAHAAENVMDKIRDRKITVTQPVVSLILEAIDRIKEIIVVLEETHTEPAGDDTDLKKRLNDCASGAYENAPPAAAPAAEVGASKTPDLDMEIDFEPIKAPGADAPAGAAASTINKTPDLDEPIDFQPIPAPGVSDAVPIEKVAAALPVAAKPAAKGKTSLSDEEKKQAVEEGLHAGDDKKASAQGGKSIRVNLDVLDGLMQMVSELVLTRNQLLQVNREIADATFATPLQRLSLITSELQEGVMKTRMQPIGTAWAKFPRLIRDLSMELGKKIELVMEGEETELDRQLLEMVKDPLTHMVRNAVDHGLEKPEERLAAGKSDKGTVTLSAFHEGGHIVVEIKDDGKGLNIERIKQKAVANGLASAEEIKLMSDQQIFQFIFKPGFSTAEKVTSVSGRGVGMDVVSSNIAQIGGTVELDSKLGKGSTFMIKIPLTLAILPVLIVQSAGQTFAIPQIRVSEIIRSRTREEANEHDDADYFIETINGRPLLRLRGRLLPIVNLQDVLKMKAPEEAPVGADGKKAKRTRPYIVICEVGSDQFGVMVDRVFHTEEIVVKPVSPVLRHLDVYAGSTILGDGSVIMILEPGGVIRASGAAGVRDHSKSAQETASGFEEKGAFLTFRAWGQAPKAVPLELISRLEEIDAKEIEWSGNHRVIQYRGGLMRLIMPDDTLPFPEDKELLEVLVFADQGKVIGMVVEEIVDIVETEMKIIPIQDDPKLLGTVIIHERATELLDVSHYFTKNFEDWLRKAGPMGREQEEAVSARRRVLLVDDSPFFRKFMRPVLVSADYDVMTAEDAIQAYELLDSGLQVDIVVTDIDMPGMNGLEFTEKCKMEERFANVPFVALTTHTAEEMKNARGFEFFSGFVSKSQREQLVPVLSRLFEHSADLTARLEAVA